ncbi:MAG: response regulator transcription factor [Clostridia bacterium]|nr:response regulator transcription factor [Clostridia bacterium]
MAGEKVLVVDDEQEIRELIAKYLSREGMQIHQAECGLKALDAISQKDFDLVVLDIMMGDMDGFEVLREIRKHKSYLPVLFLSARQEDHDKILGFGLGADDYVTKPFSPAELTARIKAHIRRSRVFRTSVEEEETLVKGELTLDVKSYLLSKNGQHIDLSARELKLLKFLMENPGRVFTKAQIYRNVWDDDFYDDNSVMVYISHLRDKIEDDPKAPLYIQTVRGIGYKFGVQ